MIAVNTLIQRAYESIGMTGLGEAAGDYADDNMPVVALNELNRLISRLNAEGFISMTQKWVDCPARKTLRFYKSDGEPAPDQVSMEPPQKVDSVGRKLGDRFVILNNGNDVQMATRNHFSTATSWTYGIEPEPVEGTDQQRLVGVLRLDGEPRGSVRAWYSATLPTYKLDETIYLPDLYNELLMSGLCYRLACYFELSPEKKQDLYTDFRAAQGLIKRNNATQRMLQNTQVGTDWRDSYFNGVNGAGM